MATPDWYNAGPIYYIAGPWQPLRGLCAILLDGRVHSAIFVRRLRWLLTAHNYEAFSDNLFAIRKITDIGCCYLKQR